MVRYLNLLFLLLIVIDPSLAESVGSVKIVKGDVKVIRGTKESKASLGDALQHLDKVRTGKDGRAQVVLGNNKVLFVAADSEIIVRKEPATESENAPAGVGMVYGKMRAAIGGKKTADYKLKVYTGSTVAGVRGTNFEVIKPKDGKLASIINLNSEDGSMDVMERYDRESGKVPKPVAVPPGSYSTMAKGSPMLPPTSIPAKQLDRMMRVDSEGNPMTTVLNEQGEEMTTRLSFPPGTEKLIEIASPSFLQDGSIPPPKGYRLTRSGGEITYEPILEKSVAVDTKSGSFSPVVRFGVSRSEGWVLSRLLNNKNYRDRLSTSMVNEEQMKRVRLAVMLARKDKDSEKVLTLQPILRDLEVKDLEYKIQLDRARLKQQEKFFNEEIDKLFAEAENAGNRDMLAQLRTDRDLLKQRIQLNRATLRQMETQKQLKLREDVKTLPQYGQLGLLAMGSGRWLGDRWEVAQTTFEPGILQENNEALQTALMETTKQVDEAASTLDGSVKEAIQTGMGREGQTALAYIGQTENQDEAKISFTLESPMGLKPTPPISASSIMVLASRADEGQSRRDPNAPATNAGTQAPGQPGSGGSNSPAGGPSGQGIPGSGPGLAKAIGVADGPGPKGPISVAGLNDVLNQAAVQTKTLSNDVGALMGETFVAAMKTQAAPTESRGPAQMQGPQAPMAPSLANLLGNVATMPMNEVDATTREVAATCPECMAGPGLLGQPGPPPPGDACPPEICGPPITAGGGCDADPTMCASSDPCIATGTCGQGGHEAHCALNPTAPECSGTAAACSFGCQPGCPGCNPTYNTFTTVTITVTPQP